ncbi:uncharacterized protein HMPREF1120_05027 [Exophiala dermatitidis NIH/UT8656]|uniref:Uncharacterized protein n=1 Tax=Exophiala dermatitidis (strain ATCC 34100 / CBS 525.76 / NIH/UT8656) TaxID=858893 RepID=H6BZA7_EXODN|nr:uncharacterized protein HMPREF1120_05027 [Exophiala dermatitidis NIH/UT8656]EHY56970.1 hypothetical protein HMPREF1120_05027 [Exophiala dermatitidis NIH/UT8656]
MLEGLPPSNCVGVVSAYFVVLDTTMLCKRIHPGCFMDQVDPADMVMSFSPFLPTLSLAQSTSACYEIANCVEWSLIVPLSGCLHAYTTGKLRWNALWYLICRTASYVLERVRLTLWTKSRDD